MALYPFSTVLPVEASLAATVIPASCMLVIPIELVVPQGIAITLRQVSQTEDFCMRAWVSEHPGGPSIGRFFTMPVAVFAPAPLILYIGDRDLPENSYAVQVAPGQYSLNIQNLINQAVAVAYSSLEF